MSFRCDLHIFPASFPRFTPRIVHYSSSQNKKNLLENIMQIPIEQIKTASKFYIRLDIKLCFFKQIFHHDFVLHDAAVFVLF